MRKMLFKSLRYCKDILKIKLYSRFWFQNEKMLPHSHTKLSCLNKTLTYYFLFLCLLQSLSDLKSTNIDALLI